VHLVGFYYKNIFTTSNVLNRECQVLWRGGFIDSLCCSIILKSTSAQSLYYSR